MKKLNNQKGSMLVILIFAITVIAVLGAGLVSIISSKQENYTLLLNAQRANMAAKAGVEWAIRFATDGTNPTLASISRDLVPGEPAKGSFTTQYNFSNDILTVTGSFQNVSANTELSHFRRYLSPISLASINGSLATVSGTQVLVPVIGNVSPNTTVSQLDITIPPVSVTSYLKTIKIDGDVIFDHSTSSYLSTRLCIMGFDPPCKDPAGIKLELPSPSTSTQLNGLPTLSHNISFAPPDRTYYLEFSPSPPSGQYKVRFNTDPYSEITFSP